MANCFQNSSLTLTHSPFHFYLHPSIPSFLPPSLYLSLSFSRSFFLFLFLFLILFFFLFLCFFSVSVSFWLCLCLSVCLWRPLSLYVCLSVKRISHLCKHHIPRYEDIHNRSRFPCIVRSWYLYFIHFCWDPYFTHFLLGPLWCARVGLIRSLLTDVSFVYV